MVLSHPTVRIGTSGWSYRHWRDVFYPPGLPTRDWLRHYASRFSTVELNATFYRLPRPETFEAWARQAPPGFCFALKASRYLTHIRRLREPGEPLERLLAAARPLGGHMGPLLFQLPPRWVPDADRLRALAEAVPQGLPAAVEFRDPAGYTPQVLDLLADLGLALVVHDHPAAPAPREVTGPFAYVRFHGPGPLYGGEYGEAGLAGWAEWIRGLRGRGVPVYAYFNNDAGAAAVRDALRLADMVGEAGRQHPPGPGADSVKRPQMA